jgi:hypothetical protein
MRGFAPLVAALWLATCGPLASSGTRQFLNVHASPAAAAWLPEMFLCAADAAATVRITGSGQADFSLRIGEPAALIGTPFQIGVEEILIVAHPQGEMGILTVNEARALFLGGGDSGVELWVFAPHEDVQQVFRNAVMDGRDVSGAAHVAGSPEQMVDALTRIPNAVGVLPRRWKTDEMRALLAVASVPVMALSGEQPEGVLADVVACLQALGGVAERAVQ